jgi:hypothetical protein
MDYTSQLGALIGSCLMRDDDASAWTRSTYEQGKRNKSAGDEASWTMKESDVDGSIYSSGVRNPRVCSSLRSTLPSLFPSETCHCAVHLLVLITTRQEYLACMDPYLS